MGNFRKANATIGNWPPNSRVRRRNTLKRTSNHTTLKFGPSKEVQRQELIDSGVKSPRYCAKNRCFYHN